MTRVTNTGDEIRHWNQLVNTETGTTLELGPGESADTTLYPDFEDAFLVVEGDAPVSAPAPESDPAPVFNPFSSSVDTGE
jgi:hypothetical protein